MEIEKQIENIYFWTTHNEMREESIQQYRNKKKISFSFLYCFLFENIHTSLTPMVY